MSRIYLNAFDMACVGHQSAGLWRHPDDQGHRYKELGYWTELARTLENGGFDALFLADVLGVYDVYGGSRDAAVADAAQFPANDPTLAVSAMAAVTERLGFGITLSLTYEQPYALARRMSTLDHLTGGRVAWNIVTSYLDSAARNLGLDKQIPHDERYAVADEYLEVCYKLWESSWEADAVWCATPRAGSSPIRRRSTTSSTRAGTSPCRGRSSANPRRSARRCCSRPEPRRAVSGSRPRTPRPCSSPGRRPR